MKARETSTRVSDSQQQVGMPRPIDPACGSGNFLASALGIYFTPQHVLDALQCPAPAAPDVNIILCNPPFGTKAKRHTDELTHRRE